MEQAKALLKYAKISPQKARLVVNQVRGLDVARALDILNFSPKKASDLIKKLLNSAMANAENNLGMDIDDLYVAEAFVTSGPVLKRARFRARGRVSRILKRTSHITLVLQEKSI